MADKKISRADVNDFENTIFQNLPDARENRNNWLAVTAAVILGKAISKRGKH
jgi:hypothetical protein